MYVRNPMSDVIGSCFIARTMSNDDRWPLPGYVPTPNRKRIIANSIYAAVPLHKSLDTRDNTARLSSFFMRFEATLAGHLNDCAHRNMATVPGGA